MAYKSRIETPTDDYVEVYPWAVKLCQDQQALNWIAEELGVSKDHNDFLFELTPGEKFGVLTAQSIITQYELMIGGNEMWSGRMRELFPRPEIERMCICFANMELGVHAPFYAEANKVLGIATSEFYASYKKDPLLSKRISFIARCSQNEDALRVAAALAILEGVVLFSNFAFFKSFNTGGHSLIPRFAAGIDASAKDEDLHSRGSSALFRVCLAERKEAGTITSEEVDELYKDINRMFHDIFEHESLIIEKIFSGGDIRVCKKGDLIDFVKDRVNVVAYYLDMPSVFEKEEGIISNWFYGSVSARQHQDFFALTTLNYNSKFSEQEFEFNPSPEALERWGHLYVVK